MFIGHYLKKFYDKSSGDILQRWDELPVTFDDIKFDSKNHKPFFIDFDIQLRGVLAERDNDKKSNAINVLEGIVIEEVYSEVRRFECTKLLIKADVPMPETIDAKLLKFIRGLISIRDGKVYFENQEGKWAWVANYIYDHHFEHWLVFLFAVKQYGRTKKVFTTTALGRKRDVFKKSWCSGDETFRQQQLTTYYELFSVLLPKIKEDLDNVKVHYGLHSVTDKSS